MNVLRDLLEILKDIINFRPFSLKINFLLGMRFFYLVRNLSSAIAEATNFLSFYGGKAKV